MRMHSSTSSILRFSFPFVALFFLFGLSYTPTRAQDHPSSNSQITHEETTPALAFPLTGPLSAEIIGNGVWWRPTFDEEVAESVMSKLEKWGFKNIFVESFWSGQTIFPSPNFPAKTSDGKDWLQIFCEIGARHNLRVHAWIHTFFWHYGRDKITSGTLVGDHPEWVEVSRSGGPPEKGEKDYVFVSPAHPEVRRMLGKLIDELCQRPIAGVNIDYIRFPLAEPDFGYNPAAVERFRNETGLDARSLTPDTRPDSNWMKWVAFREKMVTETVDELASRIRLRGIQHHRRIAVSAAFFPGYEKERGRNPKFQNWVVWVKRGLLDFSTPMCYSPTIDGLREELQEVRSTHAGTAVVPIPGLAVGQFYSPHPPYTEQLKLVREMGFSHHAVFKYETLAQEIEKQ
ncbi:MAG: family 10 glycosylhydrolase [Candidatus Sumerlaeaceae bacterium]|nr:family 10 glycosylhydrolase [Candidatus Sumerlaeaceae bacterium]